MTALIKIFATFIGSLTYGAKCCPIPEQKAIINQLFSVNQKHTALPV